jgi:PAS domain S-box-containing protein
MGDVRSRAAGTDKRGSVPPSKKPTVLVVDDRPGNLLALEVLIQDLGYYAVLANSGSEALKQLLDVEFACVLLDLRMPGIDGLETAALIRKRERHKDLPIMFITSTEPSLVELSQGYSLGAVDFIQRPLDSDILKSKIRAVVRLYQGRAEKDGELRRGREGLGLLFEQLPVALWTTDGKLTLTFCGGSLYGEGDTPRPDALVGRKLTELLSAGEREEHPTITAHRYALLGQARNYMEQRQGRIFEASVRPLRDAEGKITGVLGAAVEVTERRRAEKSFELLMEGVQDCAIVFLDANGSVEDWNAGAQRLYGYSAAEAVGMPLARFLAPEEDAGGKAVQLLDQASRIGSSRDQGWRVRKDGSRFWAESVVTALRGPDGILRGYARIIRDLTERHEADEKVRVLNKNLEKLVIERTAALHATVEELQALNHTLAHDLRAPLRALIGLGQLTFEEYSGKVLDATGQDYLKRIVDAGHRLDQMTHDLLAYARVSGEELVPERIELDPILKQTLGEMTEDLATRKAKITLHGHLGPARAHPVLFKHVLTNLLYNAIKFVAPGVEPRVTISIENKEGFLRVWVEDNGIGIAPAHHERIFRIFERLNPESEYPGTGIGLAIVKRAVERMGGQFGIESEPGRGCRFWFDLVRPQSD